VRVLWCGVMCVCVFSTEDLVVFIKIRLFVARSILRQADTRQVQQQTN